MLELQDLIIVIIFGFLAGFIDAIVGGGGLIQIPALLAFFPSFPIAALFGTNKLAGFSGTLLASIRYSKLTTIHFKVILPAMIGAAVFSFTGAYLVSYFDKSILEPIVIILLLLVLIYTIFSKQIGLSHSIPQKTKKNYIYSAIIGSSLGLYDGFFGPGTGNFLMMALISVFGMGFLESSAHAKIINVVTNIAALIFFISSGNIIFSIAIPLALANMLGAWLGAKTAVKRGNQFIKKLFILIVGALILKFLYEYSSKF